MKMAQDSQPSGLRLRQSRVQTTRGLTRFRSDEKKSLITSITPDDPLPSDWHAISARRSSDSDGYLLRQFWEKVHGIRIPEDRRASEPPIGYVLPDPKLVCTPSADQGIDNPNSAPCVDVSNASQSSWWHCGLLGVRLPQLRWKPTHVPGDARQSSVDPSHSQQRVTKVLSEPKHLKRHDPHPQEQVPTHYIKTPQMFREMGTSMRWQGFLKFGQSSASFALMVFDVLWFILKWPICGIALLLLTAEIFALTYTVTSNTFLNTFCEMKLPFVRDWVCSSYDADRLRRVHTLGITSFNENFNTIFEEKNVGNIISLPHYLTHWQTQFRYLRGRLPGANLSASDENVFHDILTDSIDLSVDLVPKAQKTFSHMYGTVRHVVSGVPEVVGFLNETDFMSWIPTQPDDHIDSHLAIGMAWLNSYSLIWLPVGIEPFLERPNTPAQIGIARMRQYVHETQQRVVLDKMGVLELRDGMFTLMIYSDELIRKASRSVSEENTIRVNRGHRRWYSFLKFIGEQNIADYTTDQRLEVLESISPINQGQIDYLNTANTQMGETLQALDILDEALVGEEAAVMRGKSPSSWVLEQPRIMQIEAEALRTELDVWKMRKKDFNEDIFEHFG